MLALAHPPELMPSLTLEDARALRDAEWEERERAYHDSAVGEVNELVRKYNALAPYAVRKPYYSRTTELERVYEESGEDILKGIEDRRQGRTKSSGGADEGNYSGGEVSVVRIRDIILGWFYGTR